MPTGQVEVRHAADVWGTEAMSRGRGRAPFPQLCRHLRKGRNWPWGRTDGMPTPGMLCRFEGKCMKGLPKLPTLRPPPTTPPPRGQESRGNKYVFFIATQLKQSQRSLCVGGEQVWDSADFPRLVSYRAEASSAAQRQSRGYLDSVRETSRQPARGLCPQHCLNIVLVLVTRSSCGKNHVRKCRFYRSDEDQNLSVKINAFFLL